MIHNYSPHALAQALREAFPEVSVQVNTGQVLVRACPGRYMHVHPSTTLADATARLDRYLINHCIDDD